MFNRKPYILFFLAIIFGISYLWLVTPFSAGVDISPRFDWPDAMSNYYWSTQYAQFGNLQQSEPLNLVTANQIHPRSFNVLDDGSLVPGSFLGLIILFGTLAKLFSIKSIIYFTPIFSVLGVLAFYGIIRRIFNDRIALISAVLLLINPAWWYYSVTSMLPNVVFVSLLLISIYLLLKNDKIKSAQMAWSGFFLGLALSIRPSEIFWIAIIYLVVLIYFRSRLKFVHLFFLASVAVVALGPSLYYQHTLYGGYLATGYTQLQSDTAESSNFLQTIGSIVLPFGFHPGLAISNLWIHYFSRLWWLSLVTVLGLISFLSQTRKQKPEVFGYVLMSFFVFAWLGIYYGSWEFDDKLTVHLNTLGLSYVRYWLPLFILAIPFTAMGLTWLVSIIKSKWRNTGLIILLGILFWLSADLVLYKKPDSIIPVKDRVVEYKQHAMIVNSLTPDDAVIITVRKDKLFFPDRKVIHTFEALSLNSSLLDSVLPLTAEAPVYYYALGPEPKLKFDNGLFLEEIAPVGREILYEVK